MLNGIYGNRPTAPAGQRFRTDFWIWCGIARLCGDLVPEIAQCCADWHSEDGCGLNGRNAAQLAKRLQQMLADGAVTRYVQKFRETTALMPDEVCCGCWGFRRRTAGNLVTICPLCKGTGRERPMEARYKLSESTLRDFIGFLVSSGGFSIC